MRKREKRKSRRQKIERGRKDVDKRRVEEWRNGLSRFVLLCTVMYSAVLYRIAPFYCTPSSTTAFNITFMSASLCLSSPLTRCFLSLI